MSISGDGFDFSPERGGIYSFKKVMGVEATGDHLRIKEHFMDLVRMYQRKAPQSLRDTCRFTPSCSAYMVLAVDKYGLLHGVLKGISRVLRCRYPQGGTDYP